MENNEVKITEHRYKQLLEAERRERIMMEILIKISVTSVILEGNDIDPYLVAERAMDRLINTFKVPFRVLKSKSQLNGYDSADNLVIIHTDMIPDFSIKINP